TATPGFFTHAFSGELNTANFFVMVPSKWARGKQEMVMITKVVEEDVPNLKSYEGELAKFVRTIKHERPFLYKALYIHNPPLNYEKEINEEFNYLKEEFTKLNEFFTIEQIQTHGILVPMKDLRAFRSIPLPGTIIRDLETFITDKKNYFIVFMRRTESFKLEIIPYKKKRVIKIVVLFDGQLSPETLKDISLTFQRSNLPLVYSSGICQQGGNCIYEVYLDPEDATDFASEQEQLGKIQNVAEVKVIDIDLEIRRTDWDHQ
ncbi:MAG: hypothetical protein KAR20_24025, partial [Candidatus Heimdallarchaeota archaeon]|nr:hypothetical protein [Candidatus Heimdallarchaeota archaeon]